MYSCLLLAASCEGKSITTIEGLQQGEKLHPLQQAFLDTESSQCGFCTPGFIMSAKALLDRVPNPTVEEIRKSLSGNICRCTNYTRYVESVALASRKMRGEV